MKKRKKNSHLSNRLLYTFITIGILLIIGAGVYATVPNPGRTVGHAANDTEYCGANQILQMNSAGTGWACVTSSATQIGTLVNGKWCNTDGSKIYCTSNGPAAYCPPGFGKKGNLCYNLSTNTLQWYDASNVCAAVGTRLCTTGEYHYLGNVCRNNERYWTNDITAWGTGRPLALQINSNNAGVCDGSAQNSGERDVYGVDYDFYMCCKWLF